MRVLGIETRCDETAAAVVEIIRPDDAPACRLLSNVVASSMDIHAQYGGVIPELAARSHIEAMTPVIEQALSDAGCTWGDIDGIAVTYGAGLGGSLLIGVLAARTLAIIKQKPLYAANHVIGHVYANFLTEAKKMPAHSAGAARSDAGRGGLAASVASQPPEGRQASPEQHGVLKEGLSPSAGDSSLRSSQPAPPPARVAPRPHMARVATANSPRSDYTFPAHPPRFPMLAIIVSGGHSQLALFRDYFDYTLLGQTQDDAIGEAFDKVAKILGLPYPGGPSVGRKALEGDPFKYKLPKAKLEGKYDFSFSGLKTAVLRLAQAEIDEDYTFPSTKLAERLSEAQKADIAASFQRVAVETIVDKAVLACEEFNPASVVIAGGVAASPELRKQLVGRIPCPHESHTRVQFDSEASIEAQRTSEVREHRSADSGPKCAVCAARGPIEFPDLKLCTDNGAMIAALGCYQALLDQPAADPYSLEIAPNLSM
jgi:N6-L-threonylcarbamoyladenine synthase